MTEVHSRPNPDELLAHVQAEEQQQKRGRLKIFLGYAAGVGKTYAMLEAAHQRKDEGVDVVVGYVETHARAETEALLAGLELIPRKQVQYHGVSVPELDVDAVLARRPQLALVDELAHTNAQGSRHPKRFQDVEELLAAGVDIYTTLNIQHLESLNDVVAQITGVVVRETVPDRIIDEASEIELIDLPPDELLQRLQEGKVYVPEQAARAIEKFFRKGNLTALRELSLRRAAERVDEQMTAYMQTRAIPGPWPATERLLVCISPGALSERLVRTARRLADQLNAEWLALYVETADHVRLSQPQKDSLAHTLQLAESLGAKLLTIPGQNVAATILDYARAHNITKLIAGKPLRSHWQEWLHGAVVEQLIHESGGIDVYVISGEAGQPRRSPLAGWRPHQPLGRYAGSLALVALATLLGELVAPHISPTNLIMLYLAAVVIAAALWGRGPSIVASILGVLAFDFFFVPPVLTFVVSDAEYLLTFAGLLAVSLVISQLTVRVRGQAEAAQRRERETATLYALGRDLAVARGLDDVMRAIVANVTETFGREVVVLLPAPELSGRLRPFGAVPAFIRDENEKAVATWSFEHEQQAGRGTETLPAAQARYLPLKTARGVVGVMGVKPSDPNLFMTPEQRRLLEAFGSLAALAIERVHLADAARNAQVLEATEKLQTALLNSISHDLRTPLVTITGALTSLQEDGASLDETTQRELLETAGQEAERLNRLVGNLLDMTRIEAGAMKIVKQPCDVEDLIGTALEQVNGRLQSHPVTVDVAPDLPLVPMDCGLIGQVLFNLVDNAIKYSAAPAPIEIRARQADGQVAIEVADRGIGIPPEDLQYVFDKFYRVQRPGSVSGTGLGLSICKGIVEAHGGRIEAANRAGGGTLVSLRLPLGARP